jgi:hypothetical protein
MPSNAPPKTQANTIALMLIGLTNFPPNLDCRP